MSESSNPGCLTAIMRLFGKEQKKSTLDPYPYRLRDDFLSRAEQSFYLVLKNMMGEYFTICPKVQLTDIFFVIPHENIGARNRISAKHVDFLICEPKTMKPRFAIELDDSSHRRSDRAERDEFVDEVFNAANLPILHIPARNAYDTTELGVLFRQVIQKGVSATEDQPQLHEAAVPTPHQSETASNPVPVCPKCGTPMVLRTARQGAQAGKQFYGCPNYPKCRVVIPLKI